ncbi:MAG: TerB family tellurite resistance protein [Pseudomonadota bacterium]|nr:hypothetical protein [Gammaproteobacteria bacterium]MEC7918284.1 TerB family tellurite resistance protein [Pseudomonadota bacterium]|tara:strand:- start:356 stop:799 length:444 start_codon:yes stop_codon:yes gene_type:complete
MLKKISNIFKKKVTETPDEESLSSISKACSSLLIEVALSDKDFDEEEITSMKEILKTTHGISDETINELVSNAKQTVDESTSLYSYTREVNDNFSYDDKLLLLQSLWDIAYADGNVDKYEEHLIRKISDLIYISHSDFIKAKLERKK